MPSPRYINAPQDNEGPNPLGGLLSGFLQKANKSNQEDRESDALAAIYEQAKQDGNNLEDTIKAIQTDKRMGPTAKVNNINQLLNFQKINQDIQKDAKKKFEETTALEKADKALEESGATPQQRALYKAAPVGGQTEIIKSVVDTQNRQVTPPGLNNPDIVDYDVGLTPKERVKRQDDRFKLQTPLVVKNNEVLTGLENEQASINLLGELEGSGKLGQGLHKLNINPKTGDLIIPQLGNAEEQLFVKTVNDFTVKAKDSFGARVTNFELDRFMQRLPTLANSPEGRQLILRQMGIINEINQLEKRAVQEVFDQYGVRNIDYVDAENKAREKIKGEKEELRKKYLDLETLATKEVKNNLQAIKSRLLPGHVLMQKPDGTFKQFPEKNAPNLEEKGYKKL